jgi:hypothetical protein
MAARDKAVKVKCFFTIQLLNVTDMQYKLTVVSF